MRAAAGLHVRQVLGIGNVGRIEDPDAPDPVVAHRVLYPLRAAVQPSGGGFAGHEDQVAVDRHVALRAGQRYAFFSVGLLGFEMSQTWKPL